MRKLLNNAACAFYTKDGVVDADIWFSKDGTEGAQKAFSICAICQISAECLDFALDTQQEYGIWGGVQLTDPEDDLP